MDIASSDTAIVITDPQNDFSSSDGVTWGLVGANVEENNTVDRVDEQGVNQPDAVVSSLRSIPCRTWYPTSEPSGRNPSTPP